MGNNKASPWCPPFLPAFWQTLYEVTLLIRWLEEILSEHGFFHSLLERTANILNSTIFRSRSFNIRTNSMVNREIAVLCLGKGWNQNMSTNYQLVCTEHLSALVSKHFVSEGRKETGMNAYSALSHTPSIIHSPQPHTRVIRTTKSLPENTFICNQSAKSKLHKRFFLKIMCITSTTTCWRTNKEPPQKSPVSALHVNWWDRHRISCEGQEGVGWEKNLVKALALLTLKVCCLVALTQHITSSHIELWDA